MYRVHVDTVSEKEVADIEGLCVQGIRLQCGESLEDEKSHVLKSTCDEAQTQIHGICKKTTNTDSAQDHNTAKMITNKAD